MQQRNMEIVEDFWRVNIYTFGEKIMPSFKAYERSGVTLLVYGPDNLSEAKGMPRQIAMNIQPPWTNEQEKIRFLRFLNHPTLVGVGHADDTARHGQVPSEDSEGSRREAEAEVD